MVMNYYEILGVPSSATNADIKEAYTRAMRQAHPDMGGTAQKAQLLNEARQVLLNKERREEYDGAFVHQQPRLVVVKPDSDMGSEIPCESVQDVSSRKFPVWRLVLLLLVLPALVFVVGEALISAGFPAAGDVVKVVGLLVLYGVPAVFLWGRLRRRNAVCSGAYFQVKRMGKDGRIELFSVQRG